MNNFSEGNAIVYCEGAFNTPNGKTAHGLVRFTGRYKIFCVIDSRHSGKDAGIILDGKKADIPVVSSFEEGISIAKKSNIKLTHFIIGLAPDGGCLNEYTKSSVISAIRHGLNIDNGLHDYLTDDPDLMNDAMKNNIIIRDIRKPPDKATLHFFTGKIKEVKAKKIAILGTDSAVGKRTTAWILVNALNQAGKVAEFVGTGQTAWLQGARHSIIIDSLINDFVSGEIEHAVWSAYMDSKPDFIVIEGQGSILNPAYPGGHEILAAARPDLIVLQHAPVRKYYDGFPDCPMDPLEKHIKVIELLSSKKIIAITLNHEHIERRYVEKQCELIYANTGIPVTDVLLDNGEKLTKIVLSN